MPEDYGCSECQARFYTPKQLADHCATHATHAGTLDLTKHALESIGQAHGTYGFRVNLDFYDSGGNLTKIRISKKAAILIAKTLKGLGGE